MVSIGMAIAAGGMLLLTQIGPASEYIVDVAPGLLLVGLGIGTVFACSFSGAVAGVTAEDSGVASATVSTFQQIGGSFGTALLSTLFASAVDSGIADRGPGKAAAHLASIDGYTTTFWWSAASSASAP